MTDPVAILQISTRAVCSSIFSGLPLKAHFGDWDFDREVEIIVFLSNDLLVAYHFNKTDQYIHSFIHFVRNQKGIERYAPIQLNF